MYVTASDRNMKRKETLNIALVQQDIRWNDPEANYRHLDKMLGDALDLHSEVDVILLPETFNTGFGGDMRSVAEVEESGAFGFALSLSRRYNALVVASWLVKEGGSVFNRLHWVRPDASYGFYDKAHTFCLSDEKEQVTPGRKQALIEWRGWKIKPAICYDLRFPLWLRNRTIGEELEYDLLLCCANWPQSRSKVWSALLQSRAIENLAYVVGVNRVGTDGIGLLYQGNSAAVDFKGDVIASCQPGREAVTVVSLDYDNLCRFRKKCPFHLDADAFTLTL